MPISMSTRRLAINWLGGLGSMSIIGIVTLTLMGHEEIRFLGYGLVATVSALAALTPRGNDNPTPPLNVPVPKI